MSANQIKRERAYTIRPYEPGDGEGLVALREAVWGQRWSLDWFAWKYLDNPYVDRPALFVAEFDGEIVGTRPFMVLRMRVGDATPLALVATDTMVRRDHRRQGLFTRMTERAIRHYADRGPAFVFNFPNERSLPGYEKLGWRVLGSDRTDYRVQNPSAVVADRTDASLARLVGRVGTPVVRSWLRVGDWLTSPPRGVTVERHEGVPVALLAALYARRVPDAIHALRDEAFYGWRFASPLWDRTATYVASAAGEPIAGIVTQTRTVRDGLRKMALADVVPLTGGDGWTGALSCLLGRIVADHRESDILVAPGRLLPDRLLRGHGFVSDHALPASMLSTPPFTQTVRPLTRGDDGWVIDGRSLADLSNWIVSLAEHPYF